jgi:hypothetical protein
MMVLNPNQLQVTTINPQANAIIEQVHKVVNGMLRSFDLENNHENLEEQEDHKFYYFLQSNSWLPYYWKHLSYNTAGNAMSTCVWQRYDPQYCLQSKLESNTKMKTGHYHKFQSKRKQELKLNSLWRKGSRPSVIRNTQDSPEIVNTSYRTISCNECIQKCYNQDPKMPKGIVSKRVNIRRITPFNQ